MSEHLTLEHFQRQREQGQLTLALVGMSNVGKSYWAHRLADTGFQVYDCDAAIETELRRELSSHIESGIGGVARWMGQPYETHYAAAQAHYLSLEAAGLEHALSELETMSPHNYVLDTTGSVVHLPEPLLERMQDLTTVVYLRPRDGAIQKMYNEYFKLPKPVVWGDVYKQNPGEDGELSTKRLYPSLLAHRTKKYKQIATVTLPLEDLKHIDDGARFLDAIERNLNTSRE